MRSLRTIRERAGLRFFRGLKSVARASAMALLAGAALAQNAAPQISQEARDARRVTLTLVRDIQIDNPRGGPAWSGIPLSGTERLTWSPDGQKLAFYARYNMVVQVWNADGTFDREIPRYCSSTYTCSRVLAFVDGNKKLLMGPSGPGREANDLINSSVFSIYDLEKNAFVQYVPGPTPGGPDMKNWPSNSSVSPDGSLIAVSFYKGYFPEREAFINVYSTRDWRVVAQLGDPYGDLATSYSLVFSPDGTRFAFASDQHVRVYTTSDWTLTTDLLPFGDIRSETAVPPMRFRVSALAFSPDATKVVVTASPPLRRGEYEKPVRIIRITDGEVLAYNEVPAMTLAGEGLLWIAGLDAIAFMTSDRSLGIWDYRYSPALTNVFIARTMSRIVQSPVGPDIAAGYNDGVKIFHPEITPGRN